MHTARLPTVHVSVATKRGEAPQVNKFEQVSSDDHQMSVAGEGVGPMSGIQGQCIMGDGHMGTPNRITDRRL